MEKFEGFINGNFEGLTEEDMGVLSEVEETVVYSTNQNNKELLTTKEIYEKIKKRKINV